VIEWGVFASNVMTFGLKNALPTFQKWVQEDFEPFMTSVNDKCARTKIRYP